MKISDEALKAVQDLQKEAKKHSDDAVWQRAQAGLKNAQLQMKVAEALRDADADLETSVVCLICGTIRRMGDAKCPSCGLDSNK